MYRENVENSKGNAKSEKRKFTFMEGRLVILNEHDIHFFSKFPRTYLGLYQIDEKLSLRDLFDFQTLAEIGKTFSSSF